MHCERNRDDLAHRAAIPGRLRMVGRTRLLRCTACPWRRHAGSRVQIPPSRWNKDWYKKRPGHYLHGWAVSIAMAYPTTVCNADATPEPNNSRRGNASGNQRAERLSSRQRRIARPVASGYSDKRIATIFSCGLDNVTCHIRQIAERWNIDTALNRRVLIARRVLTSGAGTVDATRATHGSNRVRRVG